MEDDVTKISSVWCNSMENVAKEKVAEWEITKMEVGNEMEIF